MRWLWGFDSGWVPLPVGAVTRWCPATRRTYPTRGAAAFAPPHEKQNIATRPRSPPSHGAMARAGSCRHISSGAPHWPHEGHAGSSRSAVRPCANATAGSGSIGSSALHAGPFNPTITGAVRAISSAHGANSGLGTSSIGSAFAGPFRHCSETSLKRGQARTNASHARVAEGAGAGGDGGGADAAARIGASRVALGTPLKPAPISSTSSRVPTGHWPANGASAVPPTRRRVPSSSSIQPRESTSFSSTSVPSRGSTARFYQISASGS